MVRHSVLLTLTSLKSKLLVMKPTLRMAVPLVESNLMGLTKRFEGYDVREDLILVTCDLATILAEVD